MNRITTLLALLVLSAGASAFSEEDLLRVEEAFSYSVRAEASDIVFRLRAEPGYYLYKKRFGFKSLDDSVQLGEAQFPEGEIHEDEFFGKSVIYRDEFEVRIPYSRVGTTPGELELQLKLQGCADIGLCYPPQTWPASVTLPISDGSVAGTNLLNALGESTGSGDDQFLPVDEAFSFTATTVNAGWVELGWQIAEGYYLYRDQLAFETTASGQAVGQPVMPEGQSKHDEYFGDTVVYYRELLLRLPVQSDSGSMDLTVRYQGLR